MDPDTLGVLEWPAVVERIAGATQTPHGAELARALEPSGDAGEVGERQASTGEALDLLEGSAEPSLGGAADIRGGAAHAARGGVLQPGQLHAVAGAIAVGLAARRSIEPGDAPLLAELVASIEPSLDALAGSITRAVTEDGADLRDSASSTLRRLRSELRSGRQRAADEVARLAGSSGLRDALQETFVSERAGRPVLAVKASARTKVGGIVHDASGSGQTIFVEPFAVVELNNRLAEAAGAEREEVARILAELSAAVGGRAAELAELAEATAKLDLVLARAVLSRRWRGAPVVVADEVRLLGARHPLLDDAKAVPINLELGSLRVLVLSGPNTGGKTVALKTLGLAALLHQAGLRPPVAEATLPVFDAVLADIGDRQSIEMNVSTFSGHVESLGRILGAASGRSLVLLDEVAAGTDPVEGSALAQALLERLAAQARLTLVTTHYPELKEWASGSPGAANAATGFDPQTYEPLYRIELGRPGTSHALRIAERLGLDADVVALARQHIAPERLQTAELLAEAERAERAAAAEREEAAREREEAQAAAGRVHTLEADVAGELEALQASRTLVRTEAISDAERDLAAARAELDSLREEIRAARRLEQERQAAVSATARRAERRRDHHLGAASGRAEQTVRALRAAAEPLRALVPLAVGDPVEAPDVGVRGTIVSIDGSEAEVVGAGGLRIRIPVERLHPAPRRVETEAPPEQGSVVHVLAASQADVPDELDVRGLRAQEAREAVRSFVDDAALAARTSVRVIHGRGTGAVRAAVRDELARHRLVERQEPDSRDGATVVHLG